MTPKRVIWESFKCSLIYLRLPVTFLVFLELLYLSQNVFVYHTFQREMYRTLHQQFLNYSSINHAMVKQDCCSVKKKKKNLKSNNIFFKTWENKNVHNVHTRMTPKYIKECV